VCLERVVGDTVLPPATAVVAAANPVTEIGDGWDLTPPLANRFVHLDWAVTPTQFAAGMAGTWPEAPRVSLEDGFADAFARARLHVGSFAIFRPELLCHVPTGAASGRGWPSPRSWESAARLYAAALVGGASRAATELLVAGCVGEGAASEFLTWLDDLDLGDPRDALAAPDTTPLPERADRLLALLGAVVHTAGDAGDAATWHAAWRILERASESTPDVAAIAARDLARLRPDGATIPDSVTDRFLPLLRAAGVVR
jgi:hypothetical protein